MSTGRVGSNRRPWRVRAALVAVLALASSALAAGGWPAAVAAHDGSTVVPASSPQLKFTGRWERALSLTPTVDIANTHLTDDGQGFSVETADFAHGFLTTQQLSGWLKTLGSHGVIRVGGYSMDLVWPAFGAYRDAPAPPEAIGGVVDQSDLDNLKALLDDTGWKATIGVPLKSVVDPSKVKDPTKDPSPPVTLDQAVAEVTAAYQTLGDDLLAIEIGNEYDNVTTLTPAQYYAAVKNYATAIHAAVPGAPIRVAGPSANTATTNTRLNDFVTAALADTSTTPSDVFAELTSHYYPTSHCGTATTTIPTLMSSGIYTTTRAKLQDIMAIDARLNDSVPMVINESNSASCSGQPGVSDAYATSLWSLDYLLQAAQAGIASVYLHTNTAAVCGDFQPRDSVNYPISYRYYGAFCATDQAALDAQRLSAAPLYYGAWAFHQVPAGRFVDLGLPDSDLSNLRAYGVQDSDGNLTVVLINVQDPADSLSTTDSVTLNLPGYEGGAGKALTLASSAPGGLASTDASAINLGGQHVKSGGTPSGIPHPAPVPVTHGLAAIDVAPGTARIVTFGHVDVRGAIDVTGISASQPLAGGQANPVTVSVANSSDEAQTVTATVGVPAGWQAGTASVTVPALGRADLSVPVTPPLAPTMATLTGQASAPGLPASGTASVDVITTPSGDAVPLALDGGTATSAVYPGYRRLSPADSWDPAKGYGWVGAAPDSRDRGGVDALRRDFVLSTTPATLRITVPAGSHQVYLLRGDAGFSSGDTIVSEGGTVLADSGGTLASGQFQWVDFTLDGGASGRTADLTFTGADGNYWRVVALAVLS